MLNVRYIIKRNENSEFVQRNPYANGNAWYINELIPVAGWDESFKALDSLQTKEYAVITDIKQEIPAQRTFPVDSTATIQLVSQRPNELTYNSNRLTDGYAVFSEAYYQPGWQAYLDGTPVPHERVNYMLRGMTVPAGTHEILFKFEPQVVKTGGKITLFTTIGMLLLLIAAVGWTIKKSRET